MALDVARMGANLKAYIAQARVVIRPAPQWPKDFLLAVLDRQIVDASKAVCHEALRVEFPVFIAVQTEATQLARIIGVSPMRSLAMAVAIAQRRKQDMDAAIAGLLPPSHHNKQEAHDLTLAMDEAITRAHIDGTPKSGSGVVGENSESSIACSPKSPVSKVWPVPKGGSC